MRKISLMLICFCSNLFFSLDPLDDVHGKPSFFQKASNFIFSPWNWYIGLVNIYIMFQIKKYKDVRKINNILLPKIQKTMEDVQEKIQEYKKMYENNQPNTSTEFLQAKENTKILMDYIKKKKKAIHQAVNTHNNIIGSEKKINQILLYMSMIDNAKENLEIMIE